MKSKSEEYCKTSFDRYLKKIVPASTILWEDVEQKNEPPDYFLSVDKKIYAVEVTILMQKVDVGAKEDLPIGIVRDLLRKFVAEEVESVAKKDGLLKGSYLVSFSKPIIDFVNIKSTIQSKLLSYISATQAQSSDSPRVVYERGRQKCYIEKMHNEENKVIMGGPVVSRWEDEAFMEVRQLLNDRLKEKQYRLRNINFPKILLLHNKYHFTGVEVYKACISMVSSLHAFHTIFIVERGSEGQVLFSLDLTWMPSP
jgi:hypothetical protein